MATLGRYLKFFPPPLLDDLVRGYWLPVVGAGFSRNAHLPAGKSMPLWDELGKALARDIPDYAPSYSTPIEATTLYASQFSRVKLVERISELLHADEAVPGEAHRSFCMLPFQIVCTTNLELLLEKAYSATRRPCYPVTDETQLSIRVAGNFTKLLKLHGDIHHPNRLVITEEDYDLYLTNYPLLSTYFGNLLISYTPVLIGYSLNDPDLRQISRVIAARLGTLRRPAYSIMVKPSPIDIERFRTRGITVIAVPDSGQGYGSTLKEIFQELDLYWTRAMPDVSTVSDEAALSELKLPPETKTRVCYLSVPPSLLAFYKEQVFPVIENAGLVPVTADEVLSTGPNVVAKREFLLKRARVVLVDVSNDAAWAELAMAMGLEAANIIVVVEEGVEWPAQDGFLTHLWRPQPGSSQTRFLEALSSALSSIALDVMGSTAGEPERLLAKHEYASAVIAALAVLETELRELLEKHQIQWPGRRGGAKFMATRARNANLLTQSELATVERWYDIRNGVVHGNEPVTAATAKEVVTGVLELIGLVKER